MARFDPDRQLAPGDDVSFIRSASWWNGLMQYIRRMRLQCDPATGLTIHEGTDNSTLAASGTYGDVWAKAGSNIGAATGTGNAQMTSGTVRLWFTDDDGTRTDSGIDVVAYNGSTSAVTAGNWLMVRRVGSLYVVVYEDCPAA